VADPITDAHIAGVLRAFVRGCEVDVVDVPEDDGEVDLGLLHRVRDRIAEVRWPGTARWSRLTVDERAGWWVSRVGRLTALAASVTGLAGALGDRLPLQDILGTAGQGLLLCAIAGERGVDDRATRVRLLAAVLFERELDPVVAAGGAKWLWRQGRLLLAVQDELGKRPQGRFYHRALGMLPVVGMAGDYLGERSALKRAAKAGNKWLGSHVLTG
jgi:hypothetical protein